MTEPAHPAAAVPPTGDNDVTGRNITRSTTTTMTTGSCQRGLPLSLYHYRSCNSLLSHVSTARGGDPPDNRSPRPSPRAPKNVQRVRVYIQGDHRKLLAYNAHFAWYAPGVLIIIWRRKEARGPRGRVTGVVSTSPPLFGPVRSVTYSPGNCCWIAACVVIVVPRWFYLSPHFLITPLPRHRLHYILSLYVKMNYAKVCPSHH